MWRAQGLFESPCMFRMHVRMQADGGEMHPSESFSERALAAGIKVWGGTAGFEWKFADEDKAQLLREKQMKKKKILYCSPRPMWIQLTVIRPQILHRFPTTIWIQSAGLVLVAARVEMEVNGACISSQCTEHRVPPSESHYCRADDSMERHHHY